MDRKQEVDLGVLGNVLRLGCLLGLLGNLNLWDPGPHPTHPDVAGLSNSDVGPRPTASDLVS